ncbi:ParB N-terminal domain-containing protein [Segatella copri]|uniref:ParB N-terminal domain-containing protein n=1 Tax=Segatella copri TaxID=165179 RepID=UPI001C456495|nr:ParB N-terminal domain-containing protein [Segatella copri]MBW0045138.1 ParB N-terminal domain-containing protein [Segatella copri]
MKVKSVKLSEIFPYYDNPRDNTNAVEPTKESIKRFGFVKPILVDKAGVIIAGHTRYVAAYQLGMEFVPVVYSDMDDEMAKKYRILDNKLAEKSSFDEDQLLEELRNMEVPTDMQAFFFEDINQMLNFSLDSINQQAEEYGGFQDDYSQVDDENFEAPSNEEAGESEEAPSDEEEDPAKDLFVLKEREDGSHYMKVVCPYCGNMETIEIED